MFATSVCRHFTLVNRRQMASFSMSVLCQDGFYVAATSSCHTEIDTTSDHFEVDRNGVVTFDSVFFKVVLVAFVFEKARNVYTRLWRHTKFRNGLFNTIITNHGHSNVVWWNVKIRYQFPDTSLFSLSVRMGTKLIAISRGIAHHSRVSKILGISFVLWSSTTLLMSRKLDMNRDCAKVWDTSADTFLISWI